MRAPPFIDVDGKRHRSLPRTVIRGRDLVKLRQEQREAARHAEQPPLFELRDDSRPQIERTAAGRYSEPSLFSQFH
jgi:hypothetical protein